MPEMLVEEVHTRNLSVATREIFFYPMLDADLDYEGVEQFHKNIRILEEDGNEPITIHLANHGGSCSAGMAVYDIIRASPLFVNIRGVGTVSSMGTIIMQAGDRRLMMPHCQFLIHGGDINVKDRIENIKSYMDWVEKSDKQQFEIYAERCVAAPFFAGKDKSYIVRYLRRKLERVGEWYISADEALKLGLVDEIIQLKNGKKRNVQRTDVPRTRHDRQANSRKRRGRSNAQT